MAAAFLEGKTVLNLLKWRCYGMTLSSALTVRSTHCARISLHQAVCKLCSIRLVQRGSFHSQFGRSALPVLSRVVGSGYLGRQTPLPSAVSSFNCSTCSIRRFSSEDRKSNESEQQVMERSSDQKCSAISVQSTDVCQQPAGIYISEHGVSHTKASDVSLSDISNPGYSCSDDTESDTRKGDSREAALNIKVAETAVLKPMMTTVAATSNLSPSHDETEDSVVIKEKPSDLQDSDDLPAPKPMEPSFNLAVYVTQSEVLQNLVRLGVDLSAVEKVPEAANFLVQSTWDADIQPRLLFLRDIGVKDEDMGRVLTKNPLLLKQDLEDLQVRVDYFKLKKFSDEDVSHIVTHAPITLLMPVTMVDKKLGFLQKTFGLTGNEVRAVAVRLPKIIPWKLQKLKDTRYYIKEMLGFSDSELKTILLTSPKVFLTDKYQIGKRFDYLHNVMGLTHKDLILWPQVFRTRLHILEERHRFLLSVGRAQYDSTKENYVSLKALVSGKDRDFCFRVAKASTAQFNNFLKAL